MRSDAGRLRGNRSVALVLAMICIAATAPAISTADIVAEPQSAAPTKLFHGSVAATLLQDDELAGFRGAALSLGPVLRSPKRRVILWDEARCAEVTLPGTGAGNSITTRGVVRATALSR
jgi:hypothetical protein